MILINVKPNWTELKPFKILENKFSLIVFFLSKPNHLNQYSSLWSYAQGSNNLSQLLSVGG
jgi:hypothetical protein